MTSKIKVSLRITSSGDFNCHFKLLLKEVFLCIFVEIFIKNVHNLAKTKSLDWGPIMFPSLVSILRDDNFFDTELRKGVTLMGVHTNSQN